MCSTRGGSQEMYITFASAIRIRQNPLWLYMGTSGPKIGHMRVSANFFLKATIRTTKQLTILPISRLYTHIVSFYPNVRDLSAH